MERNSEYYFKRSGEKFSNNDIEGGFADLDNAILLDSANPSYYWVRGLHRYKQGASKQDIPLDSDIERQKHELSLALLDFTMTIEITTDLNLKAEAYRRRMFCYRWLGQHENLIMDATWLISNGFGDGRAYEWRGLFRSELGDLEGAIEDYTHAIELLSDYDTRSGRAFIYRRAKMYREAIQDYTQVLNYPNLDYQYRAQVYFDRAWAYYLLGDIEAAFQDFKQVISSSTQQDFQDWIETMKKSDV